MSNESGSILIAGAGCAGLSLATHLIQDPDFQQKIVIVEPRLREEYTNDRTWSGFATKPHLFSSLASHRWKMWRCKTSIGDHVARSRRYAYESIRASDYYDFCFDRLTVDERVEIHFGCRLVDSAGGSFDIVDRSDRLKGNITPEHFFDSRPQRNSFVGGNRDDIVLWQQFAGVEVEMKHDAFDQSTATLMDFTVDQGGAIRFLYVLPFSRRRALVESTVFSPAILPYSELRKDVETYIERNYGENSWSSSRVECGRIAMATAEIKAPSSPNTIRIGLSGGLARPSTGYAFAAIHEHSRQIAAALNSRRPIGHAERGRLSQVLDRIFLSFLAKNPEKAGDLFLRISQRTDPDRFARFMMDTSNLLDKVSVILSMPKLPFILEAWHSRNIWLLRRQDSAAFQTSQLNSEVRM